MQNSQCHEQIQQEYNIHSVGIVPMTDHVKSGHHIGTHKLELERRQSALAARHGTVNEVINKVTYNAMLSTNWLAKEEVANRKLLSLLDMEIDAGMSDMRHYKNTSQRCQRGMKLLLVQLIKSKLVENISAKYFSIVIDEVTDCAVLEQLLIYLVWVNLKGETHIDFLKLKTF